MRSLRGRLILWQLVGITLFLASIGFAIQAIVSTHLSRELDQGLLVTARSLVPALRREIAEFVHEASPRPPRHVLSTTDRADLMFELRTPEGETLVRSEVFGEHSLPRLARGASATDLLDAHPVGLVYEDVVLPPDSRPGRALAFVLGPPPRREGERERAGPAMERGADDPPGDPRPGRHERRGMEGPRGPWPRGLREPGADARQHGFEVVVAADTTELLDRLRDLRLLLGLAWVSCSLGSAAILSWVVHTSLRPLGQLSREIEELSGDRFQRRFDLPDAPAELAPVVERLNELLDRIQSAFDREQAFTSDAAHELRTPLAGLRSTLELALSRERSSQDYRAAARSALAISEEMQALVSDLLLLSRSASSEFEARLEPVRLRELVQACVERFAEPARARGLSIALEIEPELELTTDRALLERVLSNLIENAVSYADEGTRIDVRAQSRAGELVLEVENPAQQAPADLAEKAFLAFWRADSSRNMVDSHTGLGLSLCRRIVEQLGGDTCAELAGGRFLVRVRLPG